MHALARELLGTAYKNAVLELNASDARGIDVSVLASRGEICVITEVFTFVVFALA